MIKIEKKIAVGILGATGSVGQKFIQLLSAHPWFEINELVASDRSAGKKYNEAVNWVQDTALPPAIADKTVLDSKASLKSRILFSALDAGIAETIEKQLAAKGHIVISNARNHRFHPQVPLLIPEVNPDHLQAIFTQHFGDGHIITNPNCSTTGLVLALKPLHQRFGVRKVQVVTMQALSGAGFPGVSSLQIMDNIIPHIKNEEAKMETEPLKLLGSWNGQEFVHASMLISASCNRVPVIDGHLESVSVELEKSAGADELIAAWEEFKALPQSLQLPSAPRQVIHYFTEPDFPQPRLHRNLEGGMAVSVGRLRPCPILDYKFHVLSHNTIRGAAGGAILNAELLLAQLGEKLGLL
ncbi:aspartate-semialdehyde dehydrogenase [Caldithrix abyssi]|uniref:Aspartate-semialdehyde dehydrogenase n=1 Tax=Caldithrix abyssi DSM 13497 TaxID=880073 RepID=H1XRX0_CALAY|nr:aspartate-semialdehyde dehydrogenase [Caldithrix abyssi]APF18457.1 aspartate semialdehyde dehydrogenase [Caldithrix abyssi DSM 13497]EHO42463.1 aspartate-semialdehyde dehydrogenase [Caldithrix abyssi DSM 13497]